MIARPLCLVGLLALIVTQLPGCKAGAAKPAGYTPVRRSMAEDSTLPFHRVWYAQKFDWASSNKIIVRPVNTQYVRENNWWKASGKDNVQMTKDLRQVGQTFRSEIIKAFDTRKDNRFHVTQSEGPNTLVLELAIIELVPTKGWLNAAAFVGIMMTFSKGAMAIEGRIRDAQTGEVVGAFADREQGKEALLSIRDFTWYAHASAIMKDWAKQLVVVLNSEEGEHVKDSPWFTLNPF